MRARVALLVALLGGCTLGMPLTTAGVIAEHNSIVDHSDEKWAYGVPLAVATAVGIGLDILFLKLLADQWSKPMS